MSRSYKKTPYSGDTKHRQNKRNANRRVRQKLKRDLNYIPFPSEHKRMTCSWDICDYYTHFISWKEHWKREWEYYFRFPHLYSEPDYKVSRQEYQKWYIRK